MHCVRVEGRVLVLSNEGELVGVRDPAPGAAPELSLVNGMKFRLAPKVELNLSNPGVRAGETIKARFGLDQPSPAKNYTQLAKELIETEPRRAPEPFEEPPGAVITVPRASDGASLRFVVLATEVEEIVGAFSA